MESFSPARTIRFEEIALGTQETRDYAISQLVCDHFLSAFEDRSPIHVDNDYAVAAGFAGPVIHGAAINGFLSHFVGMHFPRRLSLLLSVDMRYAQPSYAGDVIRLEAVVKQKVDASKVIV